MLDKEIVEKPTHLLTTKKDTRSLKEKFMASEVKKNYGLYLLALPSILVTILFCYIPMIGIVIAFQKYDPFKGMFGSEWVGFQNFKFFFSGSEWLPVTINTLYLNIIFIASGTVAALVIAVIMTEIKSKPYTKATQTIMTLPNFVSWATIALFAVAFLSADGIINGVVEFFGGKPIDFYSNPDVWPLTFTLIRIWKGAGWGSIVYLATIIGIDSGIYEAAKIDGASRFACIFKITLPLLTNTIMLLTIMSIGSIFKGDFGMLYPFIGDNPLLYPTTDVIDTYLFRALRNGGDMGSNMAIGLYQTVMGFGLVMFANFMARKFAPDSAIF